ncbi:MAG: InlB B-repeat-containing protein, partial [Kiritimatiellae bacterium]|nr:InlB B-repeat-containing protein [Kiritimatiellia bacterium]
GDGGSPGGGDGSPSSPHKTWGASESDGRRGGWGGDGGAAGANGSTGNVYKDPGVTLSGGSMPATANATTHSAIEYNLKFEDGQRVNTTKTARYGYAYPAAAMPPSRPGWTFHGWFTEKDGGGVKYYDADGVATQEEWTTPSDVTLHAYWTMTDPDAAASIWINDTPLVAGFSKTGIGWEYDASTGVVTFNTVGGYIVTGKDTAGDFSLYDAAGGAILASNLVLDTSNSLENSPYSTCSGKRSSLVFLGENSFTGCANRPAIHVREGSTLYIGSLFGLSAGDLGTLTATGGANAPGIGGAVGETAGTAKLYIGGGTIEAYGGDFGAGIGSAKDGGFGSITISGGIVKATGKGGTSASGGGAGIGGGASQSGGVIRITGGEVTAIGGNRGSGIGGGSTAAGGSATGGDISISGGVVNATGGYAGAGIGGGVNGAGGTIAISGGTVTATGGSGASGIGGGDCGPGGTITISGGEVVARGSDHGAGIGGGRNKYGGTITITGGHVDAAGDTLGAGIGGGSFCNPGTITISGGFVKAVGGSGGCSGIGSGYDNYSYAGIGTVLISGGTIYASGSGASSDIGSGSNVENAIPVFTGGAIYVNDEKVSPHPKDAFEKRVFPVDFEIGEATNKVTSLTLSGALASYSYGSTDLYTDANGKLRVWLPATDGAAFVARVEMASGNTYYFSFDIDGSGNVTPRGFLVINDGVVASNVDNSGSGWSFSKSTGIVTISANAEIQGFSTNGEYRIVVPSASSASTVTLKNLTLTGPAKQNASAMDFERNVALTFSGTNVITSTGRYSAGIEVGSAGALTIRGDGSLSATGGQYGAGIGSSGYDKNNPSGKIAIEGGTVVAQGGEKAAGIGGGSMANLAMEGNIVISGGNVTATGGSYAAGIGSGYMGGGTSGKTLADDAVKISGGTVLATRGASATSDLISSGNTIPITGYARSLCITGGSVHGTNLDAEPNPVDADGTSLRYWLFTGMAPGVTPVFESGLPENYGTNAVVADATGSVCLWLPYTNGVRKVSLNGQEFVGGGSTNNVFASTTGGVTVNGTNIAVLSGDGWTFSTDTRIVSLSGVGPFAISGEGTNVCIRADADCAVTLANLSITNDVAGLVPFDCGSHIVAMTLSGTNLLAASGENAPGIRTVPGASLVLAEAAAGGALFAQGGEKAAGIGGGNEASGGTITITGGDVTAAGGQFATGIGGGYIGFGGTISISGGTVAATGGDYGAGIGGGY